MKFSQFLNESRIQIPQQTYRDVMNTVASAYFSDLLRMIRVDGDEPDREFYNQLNAAKERYGDFELYDLSSDSPMLQQTVRFDTKSLPERYRKNIKTNSLALKLLVGPMDGDNDGEYTEKTKGRAGAIRINTRAANMEQAAYNSKLIKSQLLTIESNVDHELQHMVQDVALGKLHPKQFPSSEIAANREGDDDYLMAPEEFLPIITTLAQKFKATQSDVPERERFLNAVDPRRNNEPFKFFETLYRKDQQKWKKAVKEFHRLVS